MFPDLQAILRPTSLHEALELLDEAAGQLAPLAGGTARGIWNRHGQPVVMDLWGLRLDRVEQAPDCVRLGATVTVEELLRPPLADLWAGAIAETARAIGATPVRNLVTVGGNLCAPFAWCDLPVILLAVDAQLDLRSRRERHRCSVAELLAIRPRQVLEGRGLLVAVEIPRPGVGQGAAFETLVQTRFDYALASAAASVRLDADRVAEARVAVGAVEPVPRLLPTVGQALDGQPANRQSWAAAGAEAARVVEPRHNPRAGKAYRREMVGVLVERALERAAARARQGRSA